MKLRSRRARISRHQNGDEKEDEASANVRVDVTNANWTPENMEIENLEGETA